MDEREYSLMEHLAELRGRLAKALIGVGLVGIAAFAVSEQILAILRAPLDKAVKAANIAAAAEGLPAIEAHFIVIAPAEYIVCQMKAAFVAGLFIASPWVLYQIWMFISPGLYDHEKRYVSAFVWAGAACFCGGAVFAYFVVFPQMFGFFVANNPPDIMMTLSMAEHFGFSLKMLVAFGVVFETPVVIFILSIAGIVDPASLYKYRKYVVVVAFIVGAVLTPSPDAMSQLLLAGPLLVLYEVGVLVSRFAVKVTGTPLSRKDRAAEFDKKNADKKQAAENQEKP
jgi:sec-independent protein translocase protein TatC